MKSSGTEIHNTTFQEIQTEEMYYLPWGAQTFHRQLYIYAGKEQVHK